MLATICALFVELYNQSQVLGAVFRSYCFMLQGTWDLQAGWILFPPWGNTWQYENHEHVVLGTVAFLVHLVFVAAFVVVLNLIIAKIQEKRLRRSKDWLQVGQLHN